MNRLAPILDPISKKLAMYLLQAVIIGCVVALNEYYQWTPNRVAAAAIGIGIAFAVTWICRR